LEAEVYGLTRFLDDPGVREKIERRIHEYLGKAKWHSSVLAEKADLVFWAVSSATADNELTAYVLDLLTGSSEEGTASNSLTIPP
jgi:hypothetical protein